MASRILLYGGTRGTGALLAKRLVARGHQVRAVVRDAARRAGLPSGIDVVVGDLTQPETLRGAASGMDALVFTAGVTQRPAGERVIKAVEYDGVRAALAAAQGDGFSGQVLYMTALGVNRPSFMGWVLNRIKGNTLVWRRKAEEAIAASGFPYVIVRAGMLTDSPPGRRPVVLSTGDQPLSLRTRVSRGDMAELFVHLLESGPGARRVLEVVEGPGDGGTDWSGALDEIGVVSPAQVGAHRRPRR